MPVTFDTETIRLIALFENLTNAPVKDCLIDDNGVVCFVVDEGKAGIAIGKNGSCIKRVERTIKRNVKIFEFSNDMSTFVKNMIPQATEVRVRNEADKVVVEIKVEKRDKAIVIGRDGKNLKVFKELLQRNHNVNDLIVR
jgi:N utilization substance protein A